MKIFKWIMITFGLVVAVGYGLIFFLTQQQQIKNMDTYKEKIIAFKIEEKIETIISEEQQFNDFDINQSDYLKSSKRVMRNHQEAIEEMEIALEQLIIKDETVQSAHAYLLQWKNAKMSLNNEIMTLMDWVEELSELSDEATILEYYQMIANQILKIQMDQVESETILNMWMALVG